MERLIETHHDGHGLNESIIITADATDKSGASHFYQACIEAPLPDDMESGQFPTLCVSVQFQQGPRNVEGSIPGATEAVLLAILIDRLRGFQAGPYACVENEQQLVHLKAALGATRRRADERAARGVLGKNAK